MYAYELHDLIYESIFKLKLYIYIFLINFKNSKYFSCQHSTVLSLTSTDQKKTVTQIDYNNLNKKYFF